jgi:uncharacterized protein YjbJ (UPF0337 family)
MNTDVFKGQWKQLEGRARQKWGKLTDDDLSRVKGDRDILLGRIQELYGRTREQAMNEIDSWVAGEEKTA